MNFLRYLLASFTAFIFIFAFEWGFHGVMLADVYHQTANLWRSSSEMNQYFPWLIGGQLLWAFILTYVFIQGYQNKGLMEGYRFGILMSLLYIPTYLINYAVVPYPPFLIVVWIIGLMLELIVVGGIIAALYKSKKS